jgi:cell division protein FtsI/penicillin-binding protein 2
MRIVHGALLFIALIFVARLLELQVVRGREFFSLAQNQHFGGVVLPAKRGEILSRSSKTGETSILATNTTLDMVYVDPLITEDPVVVAETLADILVTEEAHTECAQGSRLCPLELVPFYAPSFDPVARLQRLLTGALLEPLPERLPRPPPESIPDRTEVQRLFARQIESRIAEKRVTFVPLVYGATKVQIQQVEDLAISGIVAVPDAKLIYADPERVDQDRLGSIARRLTEVTAIDPTVLERLLRSRPLRYVPVMRKLSPEISASIREVQQESAAKTQELRRAAATTALAQQIHDPLWSIALIPEHWRFYPDATIASHVVGFLNTNGESQYGIERAFDPQLRGKEGLIQTVSDLQGGQILTSEQRIVDPKDGDTIILTIDRYVQREIERILQVAAEKYDSDSAQVIVLEPDTGRVIAMANTPLFDSNDYGQVYEKVPITLDAGKQREIVVELYHPETRQFILKGYIGDIFTPEGRAALSQQKRTALEELEELYDLRDIVRTYLYIGENSRREIFPTDRPDVWLTYDNGIGVGAYLNRTVQEIYEPGSVLKPITMAIAIDQGEVLPTDTYDDLKPVQVDEYTIRNALNRHYGTVSMTDCLAFSVNTCMTTVSTKLGKKLFHRSLQRFGFGRVTGIELEDELPGEILPWRKWSNALLATAAYGQGISATPLQMVTAFAALANDGKLMRPTIIDTVEKSDGTIERTKPQVVDQVITQETAETVTAMLVAGLRYGYARGAKPQGYRIAGKTGTSQIAGPGGRYETGTGSSINSFVGFGPVSNPRFVILVKFDRTRRGGEFGSETAAPVFREVASLLFKYYGVPPDDT